MTDRFEPRLDSGSKEKIEFPLTIDEQQAEIAYRNALPLFRLQQDRPSGEKRDRVCFYREFLSPGAEYLVFRVNSSYQFVLKEGEKEVAQFTVNDLFSSPKLDFHHRLMLDRDKGVTGSMFLEKMEAYLRFLMERGYMDPKPLAMDIGQLPVVAWAVKNGFAFDSQEEVDLYSQLQHSETRPPGLAKIRQDIADVPDGTGYVRRGYVMIDSQFHVWKEANHLLEAAGQPLVPARNYAVRFHLSKELV